MPVQQRLQDTPILASIIIFFGFLGHLFISFADIIRGKVIVTRHSLLNTIYDTGVKLLLPLMFITSLLGVSIIINIFNILSPFDLQHKVLAVSQRILFYDLIPFLISIMLAMQAALNLTNTQIRELKQTPHEVVHAHIIPIIIGTNFSAIFLYIYSLNIVFISIYLCFRYLISTDIRDYLFHLSNTVSTENILFSLIKMSMYCGLISLIVGYYYYQVAGGFILIRSAMSRIITRSFIWLAISSVYFQYINN
ncbi:MAG: ABC transporter permease [Tatlockia sp.]|nr:ABC transporter permease [Tatlockia sp.]